MDDIVKDVIAECERQVELWGVQHRYSMYESSDEYYADSRATFASLADQYKKVNDEAETTPELADWAGIALEEFYEALAESDSKKLEVELIQAAAVIFSWLQDLRGGTTKELNETHD